MNTKWGEQEPQMTTTVDADLADIDDAESPTEIDGYDILSEQQVGIIKYVDYKRGFGYIKKGTNAKSEHNDQLFYRSLHFEGNEDLNFTGMRVLFKLARSQHPNFRDKLCAVEVIPKPLPKPEPRQEVQIVPSFTHPKASTTTAKNSTKLEIFENSDFKLVAYLHNVNKSKTPQELTDLILQKVIIEKKLVNEMEKELQQLKLENKQLTDKVHTLNATLSMSQIAQNTVAETLDDDITKLLGMKQPPQCLTQADIARHIEMYNAFQQKVLSVESAKQFTKLTDSNNSNELVNTKRTLERLYTNKHPFFIKLIEHFFE